MMNFNLVIPVKIQCQIKIMKPKNDDYGALFRDCDFLSHIFRTEHHNRYFQATLLCNPTVE